MNTTKRPITALLFLGFLLAFSPVPVLSQQAPAPEQGSAQSAQGSVSPAEGFSPRSPSAIQTKKTDSQIVDDLDSYRQKLEGILHDRLSFLVAANNYALKVTVEGQPYQKPQDQIFENTLELPGFQMNRDMPGGDSGYTGKYKVTQVGVRILLYKEMTPAEMNYIRSLVTVLADFNPERGDRLDMQVITPEEPAKQKAEMEAQAAAAAVDEQALGGLTWKDWLLWGLLGLLVLMLLIVLFRIMYIQAPKTPKIPKIPDAGDIADSIRGDLEDVVDDRVGELEDKVKSGLGDLEDLMKDGMDDLEDMVKDAMEDAVGDLEGLVKNAVDNAVGDLSNHVNRAVNQMKRPPEQPPYQPPPYQPPPYQPPPPEPPAEPKPSRAEEREDRKSQREEDRESASKRRDREMEDRLIRVRQELVTRLVGRADLARELMKKWQTEDTRKISTLI
ncbi:MAG: hypothetical protein OEW12_09505, partial [Deltaproteobacteria bacterium]|nr:hypothetical protein [Deltaproteobacteria bacterium]